MVSRRSTAFIRPAFIRGPLHCLRSPPMADRPMLHPKASGPMTSPKVLGIHHVTAIAGDPQRNLDFYAGILGLRLVKRTVNFDDPGTYHFYYGDEGGRPGSLVTFFAWPEGTGGRQGTGQVAALS